MRKTVGLLRERLVRPLGGEVSSTQGRGTRTWHEDDNVQGFENEEADENDDATRPPSFTSFSTSSSAPTYSSWFSCHVRLHDTRPRSHIAKINGIKMRYPWRGGCGP